MPGHRKPLAATYGRLTVIDQSTRPRVRCRCACGKELDVLAYSLKDGNTKSCGCFKIDDVTARMRQAWLTPTNPNWIDGQRSNRIIKIERAQRREQKAKDAEIARLRLARIDEQIAADERAAERWAIENASSIPPVLKYLLDTRAFTKYDTIYETEMGLQEDGE